MSEERVCKSCGCTIHFSIYNEGNGRCHRCQPGYGGRNFKEDSQVSADKYFDAPSDDKEIWKSGYIAGAKAEYDNHHEEIKKISLEFFEYVTHKSWEQEYKELQIYTLEEYYEIFINERLQKLRTECP